MKLHLFSYNNASYYPVWFTFHLFSYVMIFHQKFRRPPPLNMSMILTSFDLPPCPQTWPWHKLPPYPLPPPTRTQLNLNPNLPQSDLGPTLSHYSTSSFTPSSYSVHLHPPSLHPHILYISIYFLKQSMITLMAPPAPVLAVSNASSAFSSGKWCVIRGLASTWPEAIIASAVGYL